MLFIWNIGNSNNATCFVASCQCVMVMHCWDSIKSISGSSIYTMFSAHIYLKLKTWLLHSLLAFPPEKLQVVVCRWRFICTLSLTYGIREKETFIDKIFCCEHNSGIKCRNKMQYASMKITNEKRTNDWRDTAGEQLKSTDDLIIYCYFFACVHLKRTRYAIHFTRLP